MLVAVLSGELNVREAVKIKLAWENYWPLPRQMAGLRDKKASGGRVDADSGIRNAFGSSAPFMTLEEALEMRTPMALEAYYNNRLRLSMLEYTEAIREDKRIDFDVRTSVARLLMPLRLDTKLATTMKDEEQWGMAVP